MCGSNSIEWATQQELCFVTLLTGDFLFRTMLNVNKRSYFIRIFPIAVSIYLLWCVFYSCCDKNTMGFWYHTSAPITHVECFIQQYVLFCVTLFFCRRIAQDNIEKLTQKKRHELRFWRRVFCNVNYCRKRQETRQFTISLLKKLSRAKSEWCIVHVKLFLLLRSFCRCRQHRHKWRSIVKLFIDLWTISQFKFMHMSGLYFKQSSCDFNCYCVVLFFQHQHTISTTHTQHFFHFILYDQEDGRDMESDEKRKITTDWLHFDGNE